jgi:hypothetical protein
VARRVQSDGSRADDRCMSVLSFLAALSIAALAEATVLLYLERRLQSPHSRGAASPAVGLVMAGILGGGLGAATGSAIAAGVALATLMTIEIIFVVRSARAV